jgi:hypothetical protein
MGWWSGTPSITGIDPDDLITAAHELGHAVCAYAHGVGVTSITLGLTTLDLPDDDDEFTPQHWRAYLVGCMAGYEAEVLWARRVGGTADKRQSGLDMRNFRTYRRRGRIDITEGQARRAARVAVKRNWGRIRRLAPVLAIEGSIAPW